MADDDRGPTSGKLVALVYPDLLKPGLQEIGVTTGRVVRMALGPVRALVWGWERIEAWLSTAVGDRLKNVPPDRIVFPEPTVAVPALLALSYSMERESLRNMYAKLLATSMDSQTARDVHPSFVEVVKQLTPDECRILEVLVKGSVRFYDLLSDHQVDLPGARVIGVTDLFDRAKCEDREHTDVAISNLERQGLAIFEFQHGVSLVDPGTIPELKKYCDEAHAAHHTPIANIRIFRLTAFGRKFCECCVDVPTAPTSPA